MAALARRAAVGSAARGLPGRARRPRARCRRRRSRCCANARAAISTDGRAAHRRRHDLARRPTILPRSSPHFRRSSPRTGGCGAARSRSRRAPIWAMPRTFSTCSTGEVPDPERVRGLETYLNTVVDHGLNASTFTARVITSTGSDLVSAVVGALGALKGPLHGGAPGPALDMVFEIGDAVARRGGAAQEDRGRREADGLRPPRLQGARPARRRARRGRGADVHARRRHVALHAGARRRSDGDPAARGIQAGPPAADERRVLHGAAAARPRARRRRCSRRRSPSAA